MSDPEKIDNLKERKRKQDILECTTVDCLAEAIFRDLGQENSLLELNNYGSEPLREINIDIELDSFISESQRKGIYGNLKPFEDDIILELRPKLQNYINKIRTHDKEHPDYLIIAQFIYIFSKEFGLTKITEISAKISGNPKYLRSILDKINKYKDNPEYRYQIGFQTYRYMRLKFYDKFPSLFNAYENHPDNKQYNHLNAELINDIVFIFDKYTQNPHNIDINIDNKEIVERLNFTFRAIMTLRRNILKSDFGNARITSFKLLTGIYLSTASQTFNLGDNIFGVNIEKYERKHKNFKEECTQFIINYLQGQNSEAISLIRDDYIGTESFLMCLYCLVAFSAARHNPNHPEYKGDNYVMTISELAPLLNYANERRINEQFRRGFIFAADERLSLKRKLEDETHWAPAYFIDALNKIKEYLTLKGKFGLGHKRSYLKSKPWYLKILIDFTLGSNVIKCDFYSDKEITTTADLLKSGEVIEGAVRMHLTRNEDLRHSEKIIHIIEDAGQFEYTILQTLSLHWEEHINFIHSIRQKDSKEAEKSLLIIRERVKDLFEFAHLPENTVNGYSHLALSKLFMKLCEEHTIRFDGKTINIWGEHDFVVHIEKGLTRKFSAITQNYIEEFASRLKKKEENEVEWYKSSYVKVYHKYLKFMKLVNDINRDSPDYIKWFTNSFLPNHLNRLKLVLENLQFKYELWAKDLAMMK